MRRSAVGSKADKDIVNTDAKEKTSGMELGSVPKPVDLADDYYLKIAMKK
jgi:hypothetical protein